MKNKISFIGNISRRYALLSLIAVFGGCEEIVEPSLLTVDPILVVEARVSDRINESFVKLTTTSPFNNPDANPPVTEMAVRIIDGRAGASAFTFLETTPGVYVPSDRAFVGEHGVDYLLSIRKRGELYTSRISMPPPPSIDSLSFEFEGSTIDQEAGYYVSYHYQDPLDKNFHLLQFWRNGEIGVNERFEIRSDANVNGKYLKFKVQEDFSALDTVIIATRGLTETSYKYFEGINLLAESGSPSQAVPENPSTNLISKASLVLGIFYGVSTASDTIIINP